MNLELSSGPRLLPEKFDIQTLGPFIEEFLIEAERLTEDLRRVLFWTVRLSLACNPHEVYAKKVPGFKYLSIGFHDPETEDDSFGVILYSCPSLPAGQYSEGKIQFPSLEVDGHEFPVVVRGITEHLHQSPPNPPGGTSSCWAKSRVNGSPIGPGILTSKHVVGTIPTLSSQLQLTCGCTGSVADIGPDGIDAALITSRCSRTASPLHTRKLVAPWSDVFFEGSSSGRVDTKVTDITDTRGILNSSSLPVRVFLAHHGRGGDSGALVRDSLNGYAVGIYMGMYTDLAGNSGGFAQHAFQATELMDMELYL